MSTGGFEKPDGSSCTRDRRRTPLSFMAALHVGRLADGTAGGRSGRWRQWAPSALARLARSLPLPPTEIQGLLGNKASTAARRRQTGFKNCKGFNNEWPELRILPELAFPPAGILNAAVTSIEGLPQIALRGPL